MIRIKATTSYIASHDALWLEFRAQCAVGGLGSSAIILTVVADVKIECHRVQFGPGVNGQVRFGQHQGAGSAGRGELREGSGDHYQPGFGAGAATLCSQHPRIEQQVAIAFAGVKFGKNVQAVHPNVWVYSEDA